MTQLFASDAATAIPPTWLLLLALVFFATTGSAAMAAGRYWARRHREGRGPGPKTIWSGNWTVPHHPQDGIVGGWFLLGLAVLALGGLGARLLGLW